MSNEHLNWEMADAQKRAIKILRKHQMTSPSAVALKSSVAIASVARLVLDVLEGKNE
mgnify:CR=1 FL=1